MPKFMSLNATLMYASKCTYPEISFPVTYLSSRYTKAIEDDYFKALFMGVERNTRLSYLLSHCKLLLNLMLPMLSTSMARAILEAALVSKVTIR